MMSWLSTHGAAFAIVLPLLMAAVVALLPSVRRLAWAVATLVAIAVCATAFIVLQTQIDAGVIVYEMGGWAPPHGISLRLDAVNAPILLLIAAMGVLSLVYAEPATHAEVELKKRGPFYAAMLLCIAGLMGMVVTGDAFNVFVFLEVSSISGYTLVAMGANRDRRALTAAFNYLILGSIGATFFVIGVGFLYAETGTLNMEDMRAILANLDGGSRVAQVAFGFIVVGLGLKLAMFPLHTWLPGAYAYSPTMVTAFLASTATKAALYLLYRFCFTVFDPSFEYVAVVLTYVVTGLAVTGMIFASLQAFFQTDARRTLAFSSVAQVGYMLLGIGILSVAGLAGSYLHLINHAVVKGGLFLALGAMWYQFGITRISDMAGLSKTMPITTAAFTVLAFSLIGVPFTAGFVSKVALAEAAAEKGWWWAVAVIMVTSIIALFYMGRMMMVAYFSPPPAECLREDGKVLRREAPILMLIPLVGLAMMSILIGLRGNVILTDISENAARVLIPGGGL
ncbi:cation:proton antiporter [Algimonas arctica]|uniref:Cation:proton antiporter n=1 Tax=Algimonas arctica TaxID=1479486 RepID=A0A8J3CR13_9PROT|nr:monovalent cation/H+ antiporter subunit D family protein [Algimonas arctica]GHA99063.1 cation:proton antiporter [Algimonas arctica]